MPIPFLAMYGSFINPVASANQFGKFDARHSLSQRMNQTIELRFPPRILSRESESSLGIHFSPASETRYTPGGCWFSCPRRGSQNLSRPWNLINVEILSSENRTEETERHSLCQNHIDDTFFTPWNNTNHFDTHTPVPKNTLAASWFFCH